MQALTSLGGLPQRRTDSAGIDREMYVVALRGVTTYALGQAVIAASRGEHGSEYFPNTVQLFDLCQAAQRPIDEARRRERLEREQMRDREQSRAIRAGRTPEALARVSAKYAEFCKSYEKQEDVFVSKLDPILLAQIPDAPKHPPHPFKQARVA